MSGLYEDHVLEGAYDPIPPATYRAARLFLIDHDAADLIECVLGEA